jgi:hypothetical protein
MCQGGALAFATQRIATSGAAAVSKAAPSELFFVRNIPLPLPYLEQRQTCQLHDGFGPRYRLAVLPLAPTR